MGIKVAAHASSEALAHIQSADKVFYLETSPLSRGWIQGLNQTAESLHVLYAVDKERRVTYEEMVERVLACVREGKNVCLVSYGHPGVFAYPMHEAVRRAQAEGYAAQMLPSISAEDGIWDDGSPERIGIIKDSSKPGRDFIAFTLNPALASWHYGYKKMDIAYLNRPGAYSLRYYRDDFA
ncbi:MAG: SAM-dependent methyltransferase, partial [Candidatus Baltobacteraceae bacterium]